MGLFSARSPVAAMEAALEKERAAIVSGTYDKLDRIAAEKERLAGRLRGAVDAKDAARLRDKADRNARLLDAMRSGLERARDRLTAILQNSADLQTYDANGRKSGIGGATRTRDRRS